MTPDHDRRAVAPRRILHVVTRMDRGGIETSLMQLLRSVDRQQHSVDVPAPDFCLR
jgi:hypothetical protein